MLDRSAAHWFFLVLLVSGAASTLTAQAPARQHPDVAGAWKMDTSKFAKHDRQLVALTLDVSHHGDTLVVVTDGRDVGGPPFTMTSRYLPDTPSGSTAPAYGAARVGSLTWAADTLVLHAVETRPDRTLQIEERWWLQSDGLTLSRFQAVRDGSRLSRQTLVFTRTP
jgi:hypothetical protein